MPPARPSARLTRHDQMIVVAAWTALGLLETAKGYLNASLLGTRQRWAQPLIDNMPWWLLWAALTPLVVALARRVRLDGRRAAVAVHAAASVVIALLHHLIVGTLFYYGRTRGTQMMLAGHPQQITLSLQLWNFFFSYFVLNVLTYWAALGAYYALEYHRRAQAGELRAVRLEADLHEARLDALRTELNPHFLFNTLNAVAGLVERGERDAAVVMLARLGDLLRTTLERGSDPEIPLERELEFLEIYLQIVGTRFSDRLQVETAVQPDVRRAMVPTLILQPLVENAVRHGIAQRPGAGRITIGARGTPTGLELTVTDRAERGAEPQRPEPQRPAAAPIRGAGGSGIGLDNTRRRLAQLYGDAARLTLHPLAHGEGMRVVVSLPLVAAHV